MRILHLVTLLTLLGPLGSLSLLPVTTLAAAQEAGQVPDSAGQLPNPAGAPPSGANARIAGSIFDREGSVADAAITLTRTDGSPHTTDSDRKGRFAFSALQPGRWQVEVTGDGYLPSQGFVVVAPGPPTRLDVELRRLDERSPSFAEGDPSTEVRGWLERGNALLEQEKPALARAEYEKALPLLGPVRGAEVQRTIARTYYLEGQHEAAAATLWQSILLDPTLSEGRQLYIAVMAHLGRDQEAQRRLSELDATPAQSPESPTAEPAVASPTSASAAPTLPDPEVAQAGRLGHSVVRFENRNPLGLIEAVDRRYALPEEWLRGATDYALENESFSVYVPESYRPDERWGLLVWISPTAQGGVRRPETLQLLGDRRLIWIGANRAGNPRALWERIGLALDASQEMQRLYDLDPERIFVGGYSGGGRMATTLTLLWPEVFAGGVAWFGTSWWDAVPVPFQPGHSWPAAFQKPDRAQLRVLRKDTRLALVTGDLDFNRSETRAVYRLMLDEGLQGAAYLQIPDADHYFGVSAQWLDKAVEHLDQR